jgi:hypothetical protein
MAMSYFYGWQTYASEYKNFPKNQEPEIVSVKFRDVYKDFK